jgi:tripartite motif-containing protein 33
VISRIGTILVDGKVYPPAPPGPPGSQGSGTPPAQPNPLQQMAQQIDNRSQQSSRQRQSPTVTPPLRPLLPQGGPNSGYNNSPGLFPGAPQFPGNMTRYSGDNGRFPMPHPSMGPPQGPQPHVSSSTHPTMGNGEFFNHWFNAVST